MKYTILTLLSLLSTIASAQVKLASIFTDNMVLQQKADDAIWGWAKAGSNVTIVPSWDKKKYVVKADADGKWRTKISAPAAGGPFQISITDGTKPIMLKNVLIGEVWFLGGQSNMEMPMKGFKSQPIIGGNEAILRSAAPGAIGAQIRLYTVPRSAVAVPQENSKPSDWKLADPESVSNFSATGYYFGRLLSEMLRVPIGLVHDSYSGSSIEAWMPADVLKKYTDIRLPAKSDSVKSPSKTPTALYNGMLYPIIGYGMRGAIWYQGESNYSRSDQYALLFPDMVSEWRRSWGIGEFPFYYAQIAPYDYDGVVPPDRRGGKFNSAFIRDVQRIAAEKIPNAGMAVLLDAGEVRSIHPARKETAGTRLAYLALAKTYGVKGFTATAPTYESVSVKDSVATVKFKNSPNGLIGNGKELTLFEIAGSDQKFYPAKAVISGSSIAVSAPEVKNPVAVRYAFKDFVVAELFGNEGLPVSSFRTDNWDK